jgi:TatD DNase family protein
MIFETHAHYEDERFADDREELLAQLPKAGISHVVNVASSMQTSKQCMALAEQYDYIYASVGVHPDHVEELDDDALAQLGAWCQQDKVVALGEIGLDYYYEEPERAVQKRWFAAQLEVAKQQQIPVIIHSRDAAEDTMRILKAYPAGELTGIIHCFGYSKEMAHEFVKMGYYIGVGGVVTFKNAKRLVSVVEDMDLSHIVLETDCPYMTPVPHRGKRNSSLELPFIAEKIAQIKGIAVEEVYRVTMANAKTVYRIKEVS